VLGILALLMLFTAQDVDFTRLLVVALLAALGATWIELTRRQTLREFPDAQGSTFLADTWARVSDWWDEQRAKTAAQPSVATQPATDVAGRLAALADLHAKGELTDVEYASAKSRVLAGD
jgi:hypothetical protein